MIAMGLGAGSRIGAIAAITAFAFLALGGTVSANTWTVDDFGDPNSVACAPDPDPAPCHLRGAIKAARSDSTEPLIRLLPGTYQLTLPVDTGSLDNNTGDLDWANQGPPDNPGDLTIRGAGSGLTTIDATGLNDRIFDLDGSANASVTIQGVTLRGGRAATAVDGLDGGALRNVMANPVSLDDVRFVDNKTLDVDHDGGAIFSRGYSLKLNRVTFSDNHAARFGGAIATFAALGQSPRLEVVNSTFVGNGADGQGGGAIANKGDGAGGNFDPDVVATNSTFDGNKAVGFGGAIDTFGEATTSLVYSTLTRNQANVDSAGGGAGGALQNGGGTVNVRNSLIALNAVGIDGGGLTTADTNSNCSGGFASFGDNVVASPSCSGFTSPGDLIAGDAGIGTLSNNGGLTPTVPLLAGSPAIDHALCVGGAPEFATDQRGVARPQGAACDTGAFELAPTPATTPLTKRKCKKKRKRHAAAAKKKKCKKKRKR